MSGSLGPRPHPYTGPRVGVGSENETRCLAVTFLLSSGALTRYTCALRLYHLFIKRRLKIIQVVVWRYI